MALPTESSNYEPLGMSDDEFARSMPAMEVAEEKKQHSNKLLRLPPSDLVRLSDAVYRMGVTGSGDSRIERAKNDNSMSFIKKAINLMDSNQYQEYAGMLNKIKMNPYRK